MNLRIALYLIIYICLTGPVQAQSNARQILDRTAASFGNEQSMEINFTLINSSKGMTGHRAQGRMWLKGEKFQLELPSATTWFDGRTQWTYLPDSEEVNVSTPTADELQSLNPYTFLQLYKQGYTYQIGKNRSYKQKSIYAIELQADNAHSTLNRITLYVDSQTYQPLYIKISDKQQNNSEIEIHSIKKGVHLPDNHFTFDPRKYPNAEIIDLR